MDGNNNVYINELYISIKHGNIIRIIHVFQDHVRATQEYNLTPIEFNMTGAPLEFLKSFKRIKDLSEIDKLLYNITE